MDRSRIALILLLGTSAFLGARLYARRADWRAPLPSAGLVLPLLLLWWFAGVVLGQWTGSLLGCAALGALGLGLLSVAMLSGTDARPNRPLPRTRFTALDWSALCFLAFALIRIYDNDNHCHYAVTNTLLRGNVPPSSLNEPGFPLIYHATFDLAAAVLARGLGGTVETALDLVSLGCVFALFEVLHPLSEALLETPIARQAGRLLFVFGLGPTYLYWRHGPRFLHGGTTQSYAEAIFRRPMALNFVIFAFLLTVVLSAEKDRPKTWGAALLLLPTALLLPLSSEELTLLAAGMLFLARLGRRLDTPSLAVWIVGVVAVLPLSGLLRGHLADDAPTPVPHLALAWPPTLPHWPTPGMQGVSLASKEALRILLVEWGPLFLAAMLWPFLRRNRRGMLLVACIGTSFLPALIFTLRNWVKSDLDRFLFYGTAFGFLLVANLVQEVEARGWSRAKTAALVALMLFTVAGPVAFLTRRSFDTANTQRERARLDEGGAIRKALTMIGPREQVASDLPMSGVLAVGGFVVSAPMSSPGVILPEEFPTYRARRVPEWLLFKKDDPRVSSKTPLLEYRDYVLVRNGR